MTEHLQEKLDELVGELGVTGVAAAMWHDGRESYAFAGMTSVENPLPVDERTLFQFGSTGKTFTATAIMRLVQDGRVDLHAPVRRYVPGFRTKQPEVAEQVTVLQLLNHTAGWDGDFFADTGNGDDALARYVERMAELDQVTPLGATVSYNNASLALAGRVVEEVTGSTFEQAMRDLVLDPLGLADTLALPGQVMTRRFAVGHTRADDGTVTVNQPWALPRAVTAAGGMSATAADQLAWARFHLGGGVARDGSRVLSAELVRQMQQPTADMRGSALGDAVGISWLLREVDGAQLVGHGGTTNGQYSDFTMVPARDFAVLSMTNSGPNGSELNHRLTTWALEHHLGIRETEPQALALGDDALTGYAGRYETIATVSDVTVEAGQLVVTSWSKAAMTAALGDKAEERTRMPVTLVAGDRDPFVISEGPAKGMRGYFARDDAGALQGMHFGGRLASRVDSVATPA
ncbi:serine hydrolase [uncultured Modestobacter sp.]|uniref:serine hydrolase domain-containing protein n=1 Tax=uncultured Modestobacter sp. TaxID=380048 RepID=UPI0026298D5C|nr:serine hydrolase domain-containing protein [uncultured Modestobacter sp.]